MSLKRREFEYMTKNGEGSGRVVPKKRPPRQQGPRRFHQKLSGIGAPPSGKPRSDDDDFDRSQYTAGRGYQGID